MPSKWCQIQSSQNIFIAIANFDFDPKNCLRFNVGEILFALEECDGWYRGYKELHEDDWKLFPKCFVSKLVPRFHQKHFVNQLKIYIKYYVENLPKLIDTCEKFVNFTDLIDHFSFFIESILKNTRSPNNFQGIDNLLNKFNSFNRSLGFDEIALNSTEIQLLSAKTSMYEVYKRNSFDETKEIEAQTSQSNFAAILLQLSDFTWFSDDQRGDYADSSEITLCHMFLYNRKERRIASMARIFNSKYQQSMRDHLLVPTLFQNINVEEMKDFTVIIRYFKEEYNTSTGSYVRKPMGFSSTDLFLIFKNFTVSEARHTQTIQKFGHPELVELNELKESKEIDFKGEIKMHFQLIFQPTSLIDQLKIQPLVITEILDYCYVFENKPDFIDLTLKGLNMKDTSNYKLEASVIVINEDGFDLQNCIQSAINEPLEDEYKSYIITKKMSSCWNEHFRLHISQNKLFNCVLLIIFKNQNMASNQKENIAFSILHFSRLKKEFFQNKTYRLSLHKYSNKQDFDLTKVIWTLTDTIDNSSNIHEQDGTSKRKVSTSMLNTSEFVEIYVSIHFPRQEIFKDLASDELFKFLSSTKKIDFTQSIESYVMSFSKILSTFLMQIEKCSYTDQSFETMTKFFHKLKFHQPDLIWKCLNHPRPSYLTKIFGFCKMLEHLKHLFHEGEENALRSNTSATKTLFFQVQDVYFYVIKQFYIANHSNKYGNEIRATVSSCMSWAKKNILTKGNSKMKDAFYSTLPAIFDLSYNTLLSSAEISDAIRDVLDDIKSNLKFEIGFKKEKFVLMKEILQSNFITDIEIFSVTHKLFRNILTIAWNGQFDNQLHWTFVEIIWHLKNKTEITLPREIDDFTIWCLTNILPRFTDHISLRSKENNISLSVCFLLDVYANCNPNLFFHLMKQLGMKQTLIFCKSTMILLKESLPCKFSKPIQDKLDNHIYQVKSNLFTSIMQYLQPRFNILDLYDVWEIYFINSFHILSKRDATLGHIPKRFKKKQSKDSDDLGHFVFSKTKFMWSLLNVSEINNLKEIFMQKAIEGILLHGGYSSKLGLLFLTDILMHDIKKNSLAMFSEYFHTFLDNCFSENVAPTYSLSVFGASLYNRLSSLNSESAREDLRTFIEYFLQIEKLQFSYRFKSTLHQENEFVKLFYEYEIGNCHLKNHREELFFKYFMQTHRRLMEMCYPSEGALILKLVADNLEWSSTKCAKFHQFPEESQSARKIRLYRKCFDLLEAAKMWELELEYLMELGNHYKNLSDYTEMSEIWKRCSKLAEMILKEPRVFSRYFLVRLYGNKFPSFFANQKFVWKSRVDDDLSSFTDFITKQFPHAQIVNKMPSVLLLNADEEQVIYIGMIEPKTENNWDQADHVQLSENVINYKKMNDTDSFIMVKHRSKSSSAKKSEQLSDIFRKLQLEHLLFQTELKFPYCLPWSVIKHESEIVYSPIESSIITVKSKNEELVKKTYDIIYNICTNFDKESFPMTICGVVDAAVNGGVDVYIKAFIEIPCENEYSDYVKLEEDRSKSSNLIEELKMELCIQAAIVKDVIPLSKLISDPSYIPLHENMERMSELMTKKVSSICGSRVLSTAEERIKTFSSKCHEYIEQITAPQSTVSDQESSNISDEMIHEDSFIKIETSLSEISQISYVENERDNSFRSSIKPLSFAVSQHKNENSKSLLGSSKYASLINKKWRKLVSKMKALK